MNEENKELEGRDTAPVEEVQTDAPAEEAPVEETPKSTMNAIAEEAMDLKEKVASYSKQAKESMSADYKKGGADALVKNKYFWIVLGIVVVVLILLGVIE